MEERFTEFGDDDSREATATGLSPVGYLGECLEAEVSCRKERQIRLSLQETADLRLRRRRDNGTVQKDP